MRGGGRKYTGEKGGAWQRRERRVQEVPPGWEGSSPKGLEASGMRGRGRRERCSSGGGAAKSEGGGSEGFVVLAQRPLLFSLGTQGTVLGLGGTVPLEA
ncbi:hypothetical protein AXG93_4776s1370 [Marchantia polymorpha subsp. ruderalis]|uniref:Uncharacterized protein n=1 Tax=Marchantia polymorpha subsp. ruderalis TaxID=1480154 RepID=A0A176VTW3_MARPO|nr:hypothetical protein AXG93_4776s1370 [Marchantia polymorpha subsp. ruderalis]